MSTQGKKEPIPVNLDQLRNYAARQKEDAEMIVSLCDEVNLLTRALETEQGANAALVKRVAAVELERDAMKNLPEVSKGE